MAAEFKVIESNTAAETLSEASTLNFGSVDAVDLVPSSYPIIAGNNSYEKWIRLQIIDPKGAEIDNVKCWLHQGALKAGEALKSNLILTGYSAASFPGGGPVATESTIAVVNIPVDEPPGPNVGIGGQLSGSLTIAGYTDYIVLQLQTQAAIQSGSVNQKLLVIQWDEQ